MSKGRIIFVGIHNKSGMEPLDSRTKSGKIIDEVIAGLEGQECIKTNLFDYTFIPQTPDALRTARLWIIRHDVDQYADTIVWLGQKVFKYAPHQDFPKSVFAEHPDSRHINRQEYINELIKKINNANQ